MYVDWVDGEFVAPSERITNEMLAEITERNAKFLGYAHNGLKMLERLVKAPDQIWDLLSGFVERAEKLREGNRTIRRARWRHCCRAFFRKAEAEGLDLT
jgi:hypothetical protein